jgi:hypothetical protein
MIACRVSDLFCHNLLVLNSLKNPWGKVMCPGDPARSRISSAMWQILAHIRGVQWHDPRIEIPAPGAVMDSRLGKPKVPFRRGRYHGWREVIVHPRVERATEIDDLLGLLLVRSQRHRNRTIRGVSCTLTYATSGCTLWQNSCFFGRRKSLLCVARICIKNAYLLGEQGNEGTTLASICGKHADPAIVPDGARS